ncbi:class I SAM-dependent rRNA methyltransferase [Inmirania thermothiophila]|nr:class I SAM-dependent rRNA methyltransferase [Inmirania thermothiophila]
MANQTHQEAAVATLRLRRGEDRRLRAGHLWVYSNEVDTARTPLKGLEPGAPVLVLDHRGGVVGAGYANPRSLICARLVSHGRRLLDRRLLVERLRRALALRERLFPAPSYRLAFGEGDHLPGLVVDRYGETAVVQLTTAGMERMREAVVAALAEVAGVRHVLARNDTAVRALEGLARYVEPWLGEPPPVVLVEEDGAVFEVDPAAGQKTGWFYDQRANRRTAAALARGARVLDVFSYVGGFGIRAALAGAREVRCIDASEAALARLAANAERNGVAARVRAERADAFEALEALAAEGARFDLVILDPPALIKRARDCKAGLAAYRRLNALGMAVTAEGGFLVSCSCSHHLEEEALRRVVREAARTQGRAVQELAAAGQDMDHPVHPAMPETRYLKALFLRVI